jgi:hypothetical protein
VTLLPAEKRRAIADLKRELRDLTSEDRAVVRKAMQRARRARSEALKASRAPNKRDERERDPGFLAYLRRCPCEAAHLGGCEGPIEAAHIRFSDGANGRNPGMGRKNHDRNANPLCRHHHQHDQHKRNERAFWLSLGKDAYATAAGHMRAYRAGPRQFRPNDQAQRAAAFAPVRAEREAKVSLFAPRLPAEIERRERERIAVKKPHLNLVGQDRRPDPDMFRWVSLDEVMGRRS